MPNGIESLQSDGDRCPACPGTQPVVTGLEPVPILLETARRRWPPRVKKGVRLPEATIEGLIRMSGPQFFMVPRRMVLDDQH
jgi:hypothetical protein